MTDMEAKRLAFAIIQIGVLDYVRFSKELKPRSKERGNKSMYARSRNRTEIAQFFKSEWYYFLCECLGLDDETVKKGILRKQMEVKRRENAV